MKSKLKMSPTSSNLDGRKKRDGVQDGEPRALLDEGPDGSVENENEPFSQSLS